MYFIYSNLHLSLLFKYVSIYSIMYVFYLFNAVFIWFLHVFYLFNHVFIYVHKSSPKVKKKEKKKDCSTHGFLRGPPP